MQNRLSFDYIDAVSGERRPFKKILLAVTLLVVGVACFSGGLELVVTHHQSHGFAFVVLGLLAFIPGVYFSKVAYHAWKGHSGFSFTSIPDV